MPSGSSHSSNTTCGGAGSTRRTTATGDPVTAGLRIGSGVPAWDEQGRVFHTYSTYARGIDAMNAAYQFLDLVPKGRDEPAEGDPQFWVRRHDEYGSLSQHQGVDPDSW